MKYLFAISRVFYGAGITGLGIQQFIYPDFRPVILSPGWPSWMHHYSIPAYIIGLALIAAGICIASGKKIKQAALLLGGFLFVLFIADQCTYTLFIQPNLPYHLGLWTNPLKELALSGGAFVMAGLAAPAIGHSANNRLLVLLEKIIPLGALFFCITMISFGIDHFFYTAFVAGLVPGWFADPVFWTYFAGVALIASGAAIILKIKTRAVALLLSVMLLLWVIILHIPRAIAQPYTDQGNEITSVFEALAFSGIALGIALMYHHKDEKTNTCSQPIETSA